MPAADVVLFFQRHCAEDRHADALYLPRWSGEDWHLFLGHTRPVTLARAGDVLIKRGENEHALYFVVSVALEVSFGTGAHDALGPLYREMPGSVIGEISFFDGLPRTATVWATKPGTELLRLDREALRAFSAAHPALANDLLFALGRVLAFRMRRRESKRP